MALLAEITINVLFALLYLAQPGSIVNARPGSFADVFFFSLETLATVGYGVMSPATTYGHFVSALETFSGMALTAVLTGLLFVRFSRPKSKIMYSTHAVVAMHDGRPTLMLRIGNGRLTLLTHMTAKVGVLLAFNTSEGQTFRRVHELLLHRAEMQIFVLTWTLMHTIDESSPLYGYDAGRLADEEVRLFLSVDARDQSLGAQIQDLHTYGHADVLFGQRFADAITRDASGHTTADLTRLNTLEPDPAWAGVAAGPVAPALLEYVAESFRNSVMHLPVPVLGDIPAVRMAMDDPLAERPCVGGEVPPLGDGRRRNRQETPHIGVRRRPVVLAMLRVGELDMAGDRQPLQARREVHVPQVEEVEPAECRREVRAVKPAAPAWLLFYQERLAHRADELHEAAMG